ncbi:ParA family protein [Ferruginibacter sp.]|jgi:chromosome partitioning protein|uniref:ParA family protein n=1 Tax=Ferruginibacter sp. TaxID=1940288 RepID=UPI0019BB8377|nr:ParA family protein [Ferruginibacter sp.]MBC7626764.1 ParA family protein [Ferruginibacter sp.]
MITVALYNLKGGVGKTASCVNLAYLAAKDGFKTLLWDIDPQGSTTFYYKVKPKDAHGIKSLISKDANLESAILSTEYENLEIIGSDNAVKSFDIMMEEMKGQKNRLKGILKQLEKEYDFVFIDCPPGFSALSENIFNAADVVLMPIIPTTLSIRTYNMVKDYFKEKELDSSKLMCFFTMADLRKNMHNEIMEQLYKDKKFFQNYIPYLSDVEKMGIHRQPIEEYARSSYAAKCYHDLWTEIKEGIVE